MGRKTLGFLTDITAFLAEMGLVTVLSLASGHPFQHFWNLWQVVVVVVDKEFLFPPRGKLFLIDPKALEVA